MKPPVAFDRAGAKAAGYSDAEIDAYLASQSSTAAPAESTSVPPRKAPATPAQQDRPISEDLVGLTRSFMNAATFGQYPRMVGAVEGLRGRDSQAEAKRLAGYISEYKQQNPTKAGAAALAGDIAPYFVAAPEMAAAQLARIPAVSSALQAGARGYKAVRSLPLASKLLPSAGKTAGQIAAIEGARGAATAGEDESRIGAALKSATMGLPFGRLGEVAGTYVAGKVGPTLSKMAAKAEDRARQAGELMNTFKELGELEVTPALAKLYERSKPLREAVNEAAQSLGLPSTDPKVLAEAYSALTEKASPVFKQTILSPFLEAIDEAATPLIEGAKSMGQNIPRFSKGVLDYAKAKKTTAAIEAGAATGKYLQSGAGSPVTVGPEVLAGRMGRSYVSEAERQAAAQALIASIGERSTQIPATLRGGLFELGRTALTGGPRGVGQIADLATQLGGGSRGQQFAQRIGGAFGASR
jgi:hypothetical protein